MFIRAVCKTQKKKIKAVDKPDYAFLMKELIRCFGDSVKTAEIGYFDEDKEFIRITCDEDWEICMEEAQIKNKDRNVTNIEVHVLPSEQSYEALSQSQSEVSKSFVEAPLLETTKSELQEWKVIEREISNTQETLNTEPIFQCSQSMPTEPSIFEDQPADTSSMNFEDDVPFIPRYSNQTNDDVVIDIKLTGTPGELEKIQHTIIHQFAPHAGFEVESSQILTKRSQPEELIAEHEETDSILDNNSQMSHMTTQMRDEIESLIEEKLRKLTIFSNEDVSFSKKSKSKRVSSGNYNHCGVTCDNCHEFIMGCARFKSLVNKDYDLCETCESKGIHPGPMIKLRDPIGHRKGIKLNSEFEYLSSLFSDAPVVEKKAPELPKREENMLEKLIGATKIMEKAFKKPVKMDTEPIPEKPKAQLCHIRRSVPKPEEKIVEEKVVVEEKKAPVVEQLTETESKILSMMSRMFPNKDTNDIKVFIKKNLDLTYEEIVNKFMDTLL